MPGKNKTHNVQSGNNYYVSAGGKRTNQGTIESPWSLSHAFSGAGKRIRPGDTVWLREGTYSGKAGLIISVSGSTARKITVKPFPGDVVHLDGSIPEFALPGNTAWEPDDIREPDHHVYRSARPFPIAESYGGFIEIDGEPYSLAPHKKHTYLFSDIHEWTVLKERYLGPGIAQNKIKGSRYYGHLFIRLDNSSATAQLGRPVPQVLDPDPRRHALRITNNKSVGINITGSHLVIEDFTQINAFGSCIVLNGDNQSDITIRHCGGRPIYFGVSCVSTDGLLLDSCKFQAHMPGDRWWVSYADIKIRKDKHGNTSPNEPVAKQVRKAGLNLGEARHVRVAYCVLEDFFDGILGEAPQYVEIDHCRFQSIWDDAWQMNGRIHHIDFHHNLCLGAGPSVDAPGLREPNQFRGTVYIHHNVIDTTTQLLFWGRCDAPTEGSYESIPLSSHLGGLAEITDTDNSDQPRYRLPRKIYYNTFVTGGVHDQNHPYVGWSLFDAADTSLKSEDIHEVYNNIFVVIDGRPGGRDFDATSGYEIYDGNVYWHYQLDSPSKYKSPWRFLHTSLGIIDGNRGTLVTVKDLQDSRAFVDSKAYYPPGWEHSGLSESPRFLRRGDYRPRNPNCLKGAVHLTGKNWPCTDSYEAWRGAVPPREAEQSPLQRKKKR